MASDPLWARLASEQASDVFHAPAWARVLADGYGFDIRASVLVNPDGAPRAGATWCAIDDALGRRRVAMPFSDYCDPLVANLSEWRAVSEGLLAGDIPFTVRCLHNPVPSADNRLREVNRARWQGMDLRPAEEELWAGIDSAARRAIRKAEKRLSVRPALDETDLRAFYDLHLEVRKRRYRMLCQPYAFFQAIWQHFLARGDGVLLLAEADGRIIGGALFLMWRDRLYYKFNASDPDAREDRPNDLVIWRGIQWAKTRGLGYLDFGLSDWDQVNLVRFKRKYATEEGTIRFLRRTPEGAARGRESELRALLPQLTDLFTREGVPDAVTEGAGAALYRFFT